MIDAEDLTTVIDGGFRWYAYKGKQDYTLYVKRGMLGSDNKEHLHRVLTPNLGELNPDHANGDGLDNRRENLRPATVSQNSLNKRKITKRKGVITSSKYKGVFWDKRKQRWRAQVTVMGKLKYLGIFLSESAAARAYDAHISTIAGQYARLNFAGY